MPCSSSAHSGRDVPVSMGSTRFTTEHVAGFEVTDAWFPPNAHLPWHTHERTVLAVAVEGHIQSDLPRRMLSCGANDVWTEPAGDRHANTVSERGARVLVLQPDPAREDLLWPARTFLDGVRHFPSGAAASIARQAISELQSGDPLSRLQLEGLALELLATSARIGADPVTALPAGFVRALERLHAEFRGPVGVADLAQEAGLTASYFAKLFRRHTHRSVGAYVRELRVGWACEEMGRTDEPLGRSALRAGFADQSHFTRTFKKLRGVTPRAYRARHRGTGT